MKGLRTAETKNPNEKAPAASPRCQPNSSISGGNSNEKAVRDDTLKAFICWNADTCTIEQLDISEFDGYPYGLTISNKGADRYPFGYTRIGYIGYWRTHAISFEIIAATVRCDWLNDDSEFGLDRIHGDSTELPATINHDGFVFASGGDMWDGGFVRYYFGGKWIRFRHYGAEGKATIDENYYDEK